MPSASGALWSFLHVSDERRGTVLEDIDQGSTPSAIYYMMLGISGLIAGFGLVANSTAVVIGAMLVSPLMSPIFGTSLGLVRGDVNLLRRALVAEFGGVGLIIAVCFLLGLMPFALEITPEMLARTRPTLIDLFVAALAGLAGCIAMVDARIGAALPGVAIATALTPPLATSGLSLAFGSYEGAWGAFLLFFANFLAILAVSSATFIVSGFVTREEIGTGRDVVRRFWVAALGLLVVTGLLTHYLLGMIQHYRTNQTIDTVLAQELASEPDTTVQEFAYDRDRGGETEVLAVVRSPRVLSPERVRSVEQALKEGLDEEVRLFFRVLIAKDVASTGATSLLARRDLDGEFVRSELDPGVQILQVAEQILREEIELRRSFVLNDVELVTLPSGTVVVASIQSFRKVLPEDVRSVEKKIQERLGTSDVRLVVRAVDSFAVSSKGRILYGRAHFGDLSAEDAELQQRIEAGVKSEIEKLPNLFATDVDAIRNGKDWEVRAEVVGPRVPTPKEIQVIERDVQNKTRQTVKVIVWGRTELIVTAKRYGSQQDYTIYELRRKERNRSSLDPE